MQDANLKINRAVFKNKAVFNDAGGGVEDGDDGDANDHGDDDCDADDGGDDGFDNMCVDGDGDDAGG